MMPAPRGFRCTLPAIIGLVLLLVPAADSWAGELRSLSSGRRVLGLVDWAVVAIYAAAMVAIGVYYSRRQKSTEDYLLGGRNMRSSSIGLSLFATLMSTITYLAVPGEMVRYGPVVLFYLLVLPVVFPIVGYVLIPRFMKLPVTSAYELLEARLGLNARLLAAVIFIATRLVWMALIVYLAAKMLAVMMGWSSSTIAWIGLVMGLVTILYTWMGGLRAVVLTDVVQSYILFGGAILTVVLVTISMGGFGWWPGTWQAHWPEPTWFTLKPGVRTTLIGSLVWMFVWWICTSGSDQMAIQRYLATRDARAARRAFLVTMVANLLTNFMLGVVGFALLGFFQANPEALHGKLSLYDKTSDDVFPYYIVNFLPVGAAGLVVAGVLAAAMSSLSGGINSVGAVIKRDFIDRFREAPQNSAALEPVAAGASSSLQPARPAVSGRPAAVAAPAPAGEDVGQVKTLSLVIGLVIVAASLFMDKVPGNIVEVTTRTNHLFVAPLFGLFFFAMFVKSATPFGTLFGVAYGLFTAIIIAYWDLITGTPAISFQWISAAALIVNLAVGLLLCAVLPRRMSGGAWLFSAAVCAAPMAAISAFLAWKY